MRDAQKPRDGVWLNFLAVCNSLKVLFLVP
jgi:hypothetical protein